MDIAHLIAQWMLTQVESLPIQHLTRGLEIAQKGQWIDRMMSEREAAEVRALLNRPPSGHPHPATVLIPGIMGSQLASTRGISALLWPNAQILLDGQLNLLDLDDDGYSDLSPDVQVAPVGIEKLTYLQTVLTLARETRLYEFPYDWRLGLLHTARELSASLERWATTDPDRQFILVTHSMDGLVARAYLALYPRQAERRIEKVIMLGTPLQGATETALLFSGKSQPVSLINELNPGNDAVRFAANLPAAYQLLPPPPELFSGSRPYPLSWDPYDAAAWGQPFVRADLLDRARQFHETVLLGQPNVAQIEIAGCHVVTHTDVRLEQEDGATLLVGYDGQYEPASGDGRVPLWSTSLPEVSTYYVESDHQSLPSNSAVLQAMVALLHDEPVPLPSKVPTGAQRRIRLENLPVPQQVNELRSRLAAGKFTKEDLQRLLFMH